ncbi:MetQ/NlpA family ABC transporter substrate-binding protein, partial [Klebsiella pneumoniae]
MNKSVARGIALALLSATSFYAAADAHLIRVGFNPGPYKEQFEKGVAPYLLSKGYKIEYKDFSDGIQVNDAVARGDIEANIMQHPGNDSNLLIVFYVQIMPDDFVMQLHR